MRKLWAVQPGLRKNQPMKIFKKETSSLLVILETHQLIRTWLTKPHFCCSVDLLPTVGTERNLLSFIHLRDPSSLSCSHPCCLNVHSSLPNGTIAFPHKSQANEMADSPGTQRNSITSACGALQPAAGSPWLWVDPLWPFAQGTLTPAGS